MPKSKPSTSCETGIGPSFEGFLVRNKLGSGSYASVYRAYDKARNIDVAIKCIDKKAVTESQADSIIREIKILKMLEHPHIVEMLDFYWDDRYVYIVLEYCDGGDLSEYIKSHKKIPERVCQKFMLQLITGLHYLRSKNVFHYDLKPQNILLRTQPETTLKITDFGLSLFAKKYGTGPRGSPSYMAPEMLVHANYDPSLIDLWSLGVILYECLHGKLPLPYKTVSEIVQAVRKSTPIKVDFKLSLECKNLLKQLLSYDPKARITFADLLKHPYIQLEYTPPTEETYNNAVRTTRAAVKLDHEKDYHTAFNKYCESIRYMVPFVTKGDDEHLKTSMLKKIHVHTKRALELVKIFYIAQIHLNMIPAKYDDVFRRKTKQKRGRRRWQQRRRRKAKTILGLECHKKPKSTKKDLLFEILHFDKLIEEKQFRGCEDKADGSRSSDEYVDEPSEEELSQSIVRNKKVIDKCSNAVEMKQPSHLTTEQIGLLKTMAKSTMKIYDGLDLGYSAQMYLYEAKYKDSLEKFMGALSLLVPALREEPTGKRKELLKIQVKEFLDQAESVKTLLAANNDLRKYGNPAYQNSDDSEADDINIFEEEMCRIS